MHFWGTLQQEGFDQGMLQGMQQGIEQGIVKGKHVEALEIARNLFLKGMDFNLIAEVTGLSQLELERFIQAQH